MLTVFLKNVHSILLLTCIIITGHDDCNCESCNDEKTIYSHVLTCPVIYVTLPQLKKKCASNSFRQIPYN